MAIRKIQMKPPGGNFADIDHPETDSTQVLMGDNKTLEQFKTDTNTALAGKETPAGSQAKADVVQSNLTAHLADIANPHEVSKADVGLANVTNDKQLPIAGGIMTGVLTAQNNTSYTTKQIRNITLSTADPSGGANGDVWIKYKA